ncbi:hypothetical protein SISSUDRAFT_1046786 [Sistotremastrum suecicum HHB10207 ss-3]|uniref:Uncharacterized protein n=1 Tax=Sistotremastrum suecicum HHB10207 ss-3 TaxID=1314776 RepID=A0A166DK94_9AGAM|nr:hypothetical protein SISSUDRAFT_1046786 [Sistotremastrum suecicum HHB10207 ss-3]
MDASSSYSGSFDLCLSATPILRCYSLTKVQIVGVAIPTLLELVFSVALASGKWGNKRIHWLLVAEGWTYLILTILALLPHFVQSINDSLKTFRVFDIFIGASSSIPLLLYTVFFLLYLRQYVYFKIPSRQRGFHKITLFLLIPAIFAMNILSSFLGVVYTPSSPVVSIGFADFHALQFWTFLTSLVLALFSSYQALCFFIFFFQLVCSVVEKRRSASDGRISDDQSRGTGWFSAGLKIGVVETLIAFAGGGFATVLIRRILRMLSRTFIILGTMKGINALENVAYSLERGPVRSDSIRERIGNPISNTFVQMSPSASRFYRLREPTAPMPQTPPRRQRVTVQYSGGNEPPTLQMRLSDLELPNPREFVRSFLENRTRKGSISVPKPLMLAKAAPHVSFANPFADPAVRSLPPPLRPAPSPTRSPVSPFDPNNMLLNRRPTSDSLSVVRSLASQFPGLPPRVTHRDSPLGKSNSSSTPEKQASITSSTPSAAASTTFVRTASGKRKPVPVFIDDAIVEPSSARLTRSAPSDRDYVPPSPSSSSGTPYEMNTPSFATDEARASIAETASVRSIHFGSPSYTSLSFWQTGRLADRAIKLEQQKALTNSPPKAVEVQPVPRAARRPSTTSRRARTGVESYSRDSDRIAVSWMERSDAQSRSSDMLEAAWSAMGLSSVERQTTGKIKRMPKLHERMPTQSSIPLDRVIEGQDVMPAYQATSFEQEGVLRNAIPEEMSMSPKSAYAPSTHTRADSGVLGEDDIQDVRRSLYGSGGV